MKVIGHDDELMQEKSFLAAMVLEDIQQESRHALGLKKSASFVGHGCDEEGSDCLRSEGHGSIRAKARYRSNR